MKEFEKIDEYLELEEDESERSPSEIKRKVKVVGKELDHLSNLQWIYAKKLLKFGIAAWVFGISAFIASLLIYKGPALILNTVTTSISLLVLAGAAPVIVMSVLVYRQRQVDKSNVTD